MFRISDFEFRICVFLLLLMLIAGCRTEGERLKVCPGKATVEEALQALAANASTAVPMRSKGEAMLAYHVPGKRTTQKYNLLLEVRFNPPAEIFVQGSVSTKLGVVVMGSNREQFWLAISPPEEASSYYLGEWNEVRGFEGQVVGMSPQVVLEAFGILTEPNAGDDRGSWTLSNKGPFDILTLRDEAGRTLKRVFVYACDYRVYKIEYFDRRGKVVAVAQLGKYEPVTEGFYVPTQMRIVTTAPDGRKDSMEIKLSGQRPTEFNAVQREKLFRPQPDLDKYDNIYRYDAGQWLLQ
ncbi:MAG: hypothetical protein ABFE01_08690 [Phycisphaerales bacterium]